MKDRVPLYPGRVKLTQVSGQENTYDMVRADSPTQEGTPLNKATLLKDATAAMFGLDENAVPDDLFKTLGAELRVTAEPGTIVSASKGDVTLRSTADSSWVAVFKILTFGTWTLKATINGKTLEVPILIDAIAVFNTFLAPDLESVSWDRISAVAEAGQAASAWSVGDTKTISVNGINYKFQIIGFDHDDKTAGGKAGITFQMVECLSTIYSMNSSATNNGGWKNSAMRSRMSTFLSQLPSDLQNVIKPVNKLVSIGNNNSTIENVSDKLFLLSEVEVFGSSPHSFAGEGSQYEWYKAGNTKVKKVNGSASEWWERSPYKGGTNAFCSVYNNGDANYPNANAARGVSFAFCV